MYLSLSLSLYFCWSGHGFSSLWSKVTGVWISQSVPKSKVADSLTHLLSHQGLWTKKDIFVQQICYTRQSSWMCGCSFRRLELQCNLHIFRLRPDQTNLAIKLWPIAKDSHTRSNFILIYDPMLTWGVNMGWVDKCRCSLPNQTCKRARQACRSSSSQLCKLHADRIISVGIYRKLALSVLDQG